MAKVNQQEFAKLVGVTKKRISKAIADGVLTKASVTITGRGRGGNQSYEIDSDIGQQEWNDNRDTSRIPDPEKAEVSRELNAGLNEPATGADQRKNSYAGFKAMREGYAARSAKLDFEERSGTLVNAASVKAAAFNKARQVRNEILNVPGKISMELAHMTSAHEIEMFLLQYLSRALEELSGNDS